jgi:hypothetical protein
MRLALHALFHFPTPVALGGKCIARFFLCQYLKYCLNI